MNAALVGTTYLTRSPRVRDEDDAVSQLLSVTVEEADISPVFANLNTWVVLLKAVKRFDPKPASDKRRASSLTFDEVAFTPPWAEILKMSVPESFTIWRALPVKPEFAGWTSLIKSPTVMLDDEAVSQFWVVAVEDAVMIPPGRSTLPLTLRLLSKVEDALTNMPAVDEVGVRALVKSVSQAPGVPPPLLSSLVQITFPEESVERLPLLVKVVQFRWASLRFEVTSKPAEAVVVAAWSFKVFAEDLKRTVSPPITIPVEEARAPVCWATPPT